MGRDERGSFAWQTTRLAAQAARQVATSTPSGCSPSRSTSASPEPTGPCRRCPTAPRSHLEGAGGEGSSWYEGGGPVGERAVQGITIYPPTGGVQTQGDPFEPVKIGILVDMDLGQLLADWIDPTILAIEDALNEGVYSRGPIQLVIADARGPAPRELPQGPRRLPLAGRAGLRRRARADDLRQLASCCRTSPTSSASPASAGRAPTGSRPSTASRSPTATSPPRASCARSGCKAQGLEQGRAVLGAGVVRQGLRRLLPRHRAAARADGRSARSSSNPTRGA